MKRETLKLKYDEIEFEVYELGYLEEAEFRGHYSDLIGLFSDMQKIGDKKKPTKTDEEKSKGILKSFRSSAVKAFELMEFKGEVDRLLLMKKLGDINVLNAIMRVLTIGYLSEEEEKK